MYFRAVKSAELMYGKNLSLGHTNTLITYVVRSYIPNLTKVSRPTSQKFKHVYS